MLLMALAAVGSYFVQQYIVDRARFEILDKELFVEEGLLNGSLSFRCSRLDEWDNIEYADIVLHVSHLANTDMMDFESGDEFFVRYRERDFGPLKRENRYVIFMIRELGILEEEIDYFVQLDGWGEFIVSGKSE